MLVGPSDVEHARGTAAQGDHWPPTHSCEPPTSDNCGSELGWEGSGGRAVSETSGRIAAVILAGGAGQRFGGDKALAMLGGRPLVCWVVETAQAAHLTPVQVVGARTADALRAAVAESTATVIPNPDAPSGMAASIALGLRSLADQSDVEAAILLHADQPFVSAELILMLLVAYRRLRRDAVVPSFRGTLAPPVLAARALWPELAAMRGDQGGKRAILRDPARVAVLELDEALPLDIDTKQDLAAARRSLAENV